MGANRIRNVVFLSIDALRFDRLSYEGYYNNITPTLDFLAREGIYCTNTFTPGNPTQFGFPSIFTSTLPFDFGGYDEGLKDKPLSLPELLQKHGLETCALTNNVNLNSFFSYNRGFDRYHELFDIELFWNNMKKNYFSYYKKLKERKDIEDPEYYRIIRSLLERCLLYILDFCDKRLTKKEMGKLENDYISRWHDYALLKESVLKELKRLMQEGGTYPRDRLEQLTVKSLYAFLGIDTRRFTIAKLMNRIEKGMGDILRKIYVQFDERNARKIKGEILAENVIGWIKENTGNPFFVWTHFMDLHDKNYVTGSFGTPPDYVPFIMKKLRRGKSYQGDLTYDFSLRYVDGAIGRIVDYLEKSGLLEDSLIVICGDHGHRMAKRGRKGSSAGAFYEEDIKVPLIFYNPGLKPRRITELCSLMDISPTILSLLGLGQAEEFKGVSVISDEIRKRDFVLLEHNFRGPCDLDHKPVYLALRTNSYKYVHRESISFNDPWSEYKRELYDLKKDPEERDNLLNHSGYADVFNELEKIAIKRLHEVRSLHEEKKEEPVNNRGFVLWLTGLSGSGKTTYANRLHSLLGGRRLEVVDGDNFRETFSKDLGYEYKDRVLNVKRIARFARMLADRGTNVIVANIAPFYEARDFIRQTIGPYVQVYLKADIGVLEKRDPKGLYAGSKTGKIGNVIGIHDLYHEPRNPDIVIDTGEKSVDEGVQKILGHLYEKKLIGKIY